jgi:hypothetical protein
MTEELEDNLDTELEDGLDNEPADNEVDETDYDAEAEKQGWVPKEKYKGDPKRWVDAKTFVERGEIFRPMLHTKYKEVETELADTKRQLAEQAAAIERNNKIAERFQERARQEALEQIKREQRVAFEQGDDAKYNELDKRRDNIAKEFEVEPVKVKAETNQPDPYVVKFQQENPWFGKDFTLTQAAQFHDARLARENPYMSPESRHTEVRKLVVAEFPNKFENPNRGQKNGLGSGRNPGKQPPAKKGWDAIPEVDRKLAAGFIKGGMSKEDYAKDYWELSKEKDDE